MAIAFSVPAYVPDQASGETIVGYQVQSLAPVAGLPQTYGSWSDVNSGTPFASNVNIFDPNGTANTSYRVRPVRQVTVGGTLYTIDTPWSRPIQASTPVYDGVFTRFLLPALRMTYLQDQGVAQANGTVLGETQGAGDGLWLFDGTKTRFQLQYVMNDDPVRVLSGLYRMTYKLANGTQVQKLPDVDYTVDERAGVVEFATAPHADDYARFEFRRCDFVNDDLLLALNGAVNSLSSFGKGGYQMNSVQNLYVLNKPLESPDLGEILCHMAIYLMREGLSETALRNATSWRDGGESVDPFGSRGLEAIVNKLTVSEDTIRRKVNNYIRMSTRPQGYGEFETFWNMSEFTPLVSGMFGALLTGVPGYIGSSVPWYGWWL